jgi:hypothetical protein
VVIAATNASELTIALAELQVRYPYLKAVGEGAPSALRSLGYNALASGALAPEDVFRWRMDEAIRGATKAGKLIYSR